LVSRVVVVAASVSVMMVPAAVPASTVTTTVKVLTVPGAKLGLVQPEAKEVQVHPAGAPLYELKVVFAGTASLKVTLAQLLGPVLVTVCV
jgi:hypothetical protein